MEARSPHSRKYTVDEYLRLEGESSEKHEFRDGEIIAMAGGTEAHSLITANLISGLHLRVKNKDCRVYDSNLRVRIARRFRYAYPDVFVICGNTLFDEADANHTTVTNPRVIVEVLSPSTELSDRGEKFARYILLDSLEEYVLVAQDQPRIETYHRHSHGTWLFAYFQGPDAVARLRSLGLEIPLTEIYAGVVFEPRPA